MTALTLAAKAGAAPHIVEYRKPPATGAEQLYANMLKTTRKDAELAIGLWAAEVTGAADIIREGGRVRSRDYVVGVDFTQGKDQQATWPESR